MFFLVLFKLNEKIEGNFLINNLGIEKKKNYIW
jgi:hypothetical protein